MVPAEPTKKNIDFLVKLWSILFLFSNLDAELQEQDKV
jgi:hypothetical protein